MVEESKSASQTQDRLISRRKEISIAAKTLSAKVSSYATELQQADMVQKVFNASELLHELLCQAEIVTGIVDDMRRKIEESRITPENVDGCCFGQVDDYLKSFEEATQ